MGGVFFVKKVENGGLLKSGKWGFFVKKVDLSSTQGALCTVSVFFILHYFTYSGCVRTQRTPPCLRTGLNIQCGQVGRTC